jgi:hypothetical protein
MISGGLASSSSRDWLAPTAKGSRLLRRDPSSLRDGRHQGPPGRRPWWIDKSELDDQ